VLEARGGLGWQGVLRNSQRSRCVSESERVDERVNERHTAMREVYIIVSWDSTTCVKCLSVVRKIELLARGMSIPPRGSFTVPRNVTFKPYKLWCKVNGIIHFSGNSAELVRWYLSSTSVPAPLSSICDHTSPSLKSSNWVS
jgi:hypothetical protein